MELTGLLVETLDQEQKSYYEFSHSTFRDYLASLYILDDKSLEPNLIASIGDDWWIETIRLYAAATDATNIVAASIKDKSPEIFAMNSCDRLYDRSIDYQK